MRRSTRQELRKCRELIRVLLSHAYTPNIKKGVEVCFFCEKQLLTEGRIDVGNADGAPFKDKVTFHHKNGNHEDDRARNIFLSHTTCHKSFHMKDQWKKKNLTGKRKKKTPVIFYARVVNSNMMQEYDCGHRHRRKGGARACVRKMKGKYPNGKWIRSIIKEAA